MLLKVASINFCALLLFSCTSPPVTKNTPSTNHPSAVPKEDSPQATVYPHHDSTASPLSTQSFCENFIFTGSANTKPPCGLKSERCFLPGDQRFSPQTIICGNGAAAYTNFVCQKDPTATKDLVNKIVCTPLDQTAPDSTSICDNITKNNTLDPVNWEPCPEGVNELCTIPEDGRFFPSLYEDCRQHYMIYVCSKFPYAPQELLDRITCKNSPKPRGI